MTTIMAGATGKRFYYFASAFVRGISFLGALVAFIVVKLAVQPNIVWLNILLIALAIGGLLSGIFNLILCGFTATSYQEKKGLQIVCLLVTIFTGGILGTIFTSIAIGCKVTKEEIENEKLIRIK